MTRANMKRLIAVAGAVWLGMVITPAVLTAQEFGIPFIHWPALYDAAENAVVKRGTNANGTSNGYLYFRIGWGECLAVRLDELETLHGNAPGDRYLNFRQYAENELQSDQWNAEHAANCPRPALEVKSTWRNSRPVYFREYSEEDSIWYKGKRSSYRVMADGALPAYECLHWNAANADGTASNYWTLADTTQVYDGNGSYLVGEISMPRNLMLAAVCTEQDVDILDHRF